MRALGLMIGLFGVTLLGLPDSLAGQSIAFEARVGVAWHGSAPCHHLRRSRGLAVGIEARTRGAWIASAAVDLMLDDWGYGCLDVGLPEFEYQGRLVSLLGSSVAAARSKVSVGHMITIGGFRSALTGGAGLLPTYTDYGPDRGDFSWQPWYGGTLTVGIQSSGVGVQLELGRHRLTQRYYSVDTDVLVDEVHHWERLIRLGVSIPL